MKPPALGVKIAREIAAKKGVEPAALEPPVQAVIDVTALEKLIHTRPHTRTEFTGVVSFTHTEYTVTVDQTGTVSVSPQSDLETNDETRETPSDPA